MCGLIGFLGGEFNGTSEETSLRRMTDTLIHRGPDSSGYWYNTQQRIGIGHRRLSIVDLSEAGHQPMLSISGRFVIAYNGEIYNHLDLRSEIYPENSTSNNWRGHSDTETLLAGFEVWGIEKTLKKATGMFAIALWDRQEKVLTLARDRMGEKPLYYGFQQNVFFFGSELKALKAHQDFLGEIDRDAISLYLRHCYIPTPYSIYKGIKKLLPGTYLQLSLGQESNSSFEIIPKEYWSLKGVMREGIDNQFTGNIADSITALDSQLKHSIGLQMMADVPLGTFLSGGVDSSTVAALMQAQSILPIKTFSIGFDEQDFNEAKYASAVAKHLGTDHTELYMTSVEAMQIIPTIGSIYDEPFADSSQIPTFLVSKMAREYVTVALSGDGGDELFCGYDSYSLAKIWAQIMKVPFSVRKMAGHTIKAFSPSIDVAFSHLSINIDMSAKLDNLSTRLMSINNIGELYYNLTSVISYPERVVIGVKEPSTWLTEIGMKTSFDDPKLQMMFIDAMTYLPDDILVKVDRASMANSLETRIPLLDHNVIEFASKLPMSMKVRDGKNKWILREVLYQYVPKKLIERPKSGFSIPLGKWLSGPLREWVDVMLDEQRLCQEGFFNVEYVCKKWQEHTSGRKNNQTFIWSILMFQVWLEEQ